MLFWDKIKIIEQGHLKLGVLFSFLFLYKIYISLKIYISWLYLENILKEEVKIERMIYDETL